MTKECRLLIDMSANERGSILVLESAFTYDLMEKNISPINFSLSVLVTTVLCQ